jgi:hypothetical protein
MLNPIPFSYTLNPNPFTYTLNPNPFTHTQTFTLLYLRIGISNTNKLG